MDAIHKESYNNSVSEANPNKKILESSLEKMKPFNDSMQLRDLQSHLEKLNTNRGHTQQTIFFTEANEIQNKNAIKRYVSETQLSRSAYIQKEKSIKTNVDQFKKEKEPENLNLSKEIDHEELKVDNIAQISDNRPIHDINELTTLNQGQNTEALGFTEVQSTNHHVALEVNNPQESPFQIPRPPQIPSDIECCAYLRRYLVFFLALSLASMILVFVAHKSLPSIAFFVILYSYWIYVMFDNVIEAFNSRREIWRRKEDFMTAVDGASAIFATACINLKIFNLVGFSLASSFPYLLVFIIYICISDAPRSTKNWNILLRSCYFAQILSITLKLDGFLALEWKNIFVLIWIYLAVICLHFIVYGFFAILIILKTLSLYPQSNSNRLTPQLVGFTWFSLYYALGIPGFLFFTEFHEFLEDGKTDQLFFASAWTIVVINTLLVIYATLAYKLLTVFIKVLVLSLDSSNLSNKQSEKKKISFLTEKKDSYFKIVSPTYYFPLDLQLSPNKKYKYYKSKKLSMLSRIQLEQNSSTISIEQLRQNKLILDEKLKSIQLATDKHILKKNKFNKQTLKPLRRSWVDFHIEGKKSSSKPLSDQNTFVLTKTEKKGDNLCYVCFQKAGDAIMMNCGHGGICIDCAIISIQKKNSCIQCRRIVETIHRIDHRQKFANLIKSTEVIKINHN